MFKEPTTTTPPTDTGETETTIGPAAPRRGETIRDRILSASQVGETTRRPQQPPPGAPAYRMRQFLAELDRYVQFPHLSRKDRRKMAGQSDPRNVPDASGKVRAAARGKPRKEPGP